MRNTQAIILGRTTGQEVISCTVNGEEIPVKDITADVMGLYPRRYRTPSGKEEDLIPVFLSPEMPGHYSIINPEWRDAPYEERFIQSDFFLELPDEKK